jgi:hypothetical protein
MDSKLPPGSINPTSNWARKKDPSKKSDSTHTSRDKWNETCLPYATMHTNSRKYCSGGKPILSPLPSQFVDLSGEDWTSKAQPTVYKMSNEAVRRRKTSNDVLEVSSKRHRSRSKFRVPSRRTSGQKPVEIIDLTQPSSIETIRKENRLYFSYDPRGIENDDHLPEDYCLMCRCPNQYCAEKMFGKYLYKLMEKQISRMGFEYYDKEKDIFF